MTTPVEVKVSDFNLDKLSTKKFKDHIKFSIRAGSNIAAFGRRGLGKTQISKQAIHEENLIEVYVNLSVFERVDLGGYPDMLTKPEANEERFIKYLLPVMYRPMITGNKKVVLLLDEVDKADQSLWAPLLELVNLKSINGRPLPNLQSVIMTGNLISEGGNRPSLPLLDRTEKYLVEATAHDWLEWAAAEGSGIHPAVFKFITDSPTSLTGSVDANDYYADESPRGWTLSSKVITFGEENGWDIDLLTEKVSGYVGKKAGIDFKLYLIGYKTLLPMVDKIFNDEEYSSTWKNLTPSEKLYASTIVFGRFCNQLDSSDLSNPPKSVELVGKFMQRCGHENVMINVRQQLTVARLIKHKLDRHADWAEVLKDMKKTMLNK